MNNTKRKKLSGRVTFFLFTLIPVVLYTFFLCGICNQWYSIQFYRLGWNGSENEFYRVEEL